MAVQEIPKHEAVSNAVAGTSGTSSPRRCLILANPEAGAIKKLSARRAFWQYLTQWRERVLPDESIPLTPAAHEAPPLFLTAIAEAAGQAGLESMVEAAPPPSGLRARVRQAEREGFDVIVAVGGDGTVRSVAQALIDSPLILGIVPLGTANNIAHSLSLPFDLPAAMRVLRDGIPRDMDAGRIGEEYFLEAAGVGLFADAMQAFGSDEPRPYQVARLFRVLWPLLWNLRPRALRLTLDGKPHGEDAVMVTVANGPYMGEGVSVAPDASLSDGLFDVITIGRLSHIQLLRFAFALLRGQHLALPFVHMTRARRVEIQRIHRAHRSLPVHADDHIAARTPVTLTVLPNALRVLVPPAA